MRVVLGGHADLREEIWAGLTAVAHPMKYCLGGIFQSLEILKPPTPAPLQIKFLTLLTTFNLVLYIPEDVS